MQSPVGAPVQEFLGPRAVQQILTLDGFARDNPGELPTVMTGDFNCTPDSLVHQFLTGRASLREKGTYWRDCFAHRHPHSDGSS